MKLCKDCQHKNFLPNGNKWCMATASNEIDPVDGEEHVEGIWWCRSRNRAGQCSLFKPEGDTHV